MIEPLEYFIAPAKRRPWRTWLAILSIPLLLLAWFFGSIWLDMETAKISVVIINSSGSALKSAQLRSGSRVLIDFGDISVDKHCKIARRFAYEGPTSFHATCGDQIYADDTWLVLTGKGPYEYEFTVFSDHIHLERWSPPKGVWKQDIFPKSVAAPGAMH